MSGNGNERGSDATIREGKVYRIVLAFDTVSEVMTWDIQDMPTVIAVGLLEHALTQVRRADAAKAMQEMVGGNRRVLFPGSLR